MLPVPSEVAANERKVICFEEKAKDMEALVKQRDHEGAGLHARLHCWDIRPPARHPFQGTDKETPDKETPLANFPGMIGRGGGKSIYCRTIVPRK